MGLEDGTNSRAYCIGLDDVRAAAARIAGRVVRTPCLHSRTLSAITGCEIWLKFETQQFTASFKERGALNRLLKLDEAAKTRGVIAMSAGNHAQGVAYHGRALGIPVTIVMPRFTPFVKVENTQRLGARILLEGDGVDEAAVFARELCQRQNLTFIHPYDDPLIIAGQGTIALEMLEETPELDMLVVPIGGGGLLSGMAVATKAISPRTALFGVEAALYPSMLHRLEGRGPPQGGSTIADGIAVKEPGELTLPIIRELVDKVLLVDEPAIEAAILLLLEIEKTVAEGAAAACLAAVLAHRETFLGKRVGLVLCGGNIDSRLLSAVILRGLVRSHRLVRYRVCVPDAPGSLARITQVIAQRGGNIVEVTHQRAFSLRSVRQADVELTIETRTGEHALELATALRAEGFEVTELAAD